MFRLQGLYLDYALFYCSSPIDTAEEGYIFAVWQLALRIYELVSFLYLQTSFSSSFSSCMIILDECLDELLSLIICAKVVSIN